MRFLRLVTVAFAVLVVAPIAVARGDVPHGGVASAEPPINVSKRLASISPAAASDRRVPPGRSCPPARPGCLKTPGASTYRAFLDWVAKNVDDMYAEEGGKLWPRPWYYLLAGAQRTTTRCAGGSNVVTAASGPFYCSADRGGTIFLTMNWLKKETFRSASYKTKDFALAYVVAHEWAHHAQSRYIFVGSEAFFEKLRSIHVELMADCLAGIWARSVYHKSLLESGDFNEAVALARRLKDYPGTDPAEEGAHGTARQRAYWLRRGYNGGSCRTYDSPTLPALRP